MGRHAEAPSPCMVVSVSDGELVSLRALLEKEQTMLVLLRHFACLHSHVYLDVVTNTIDRYNASHCHTKRKSVSLVVVGFGTVEQGSTFRRKTGYEGEIYCVPNVDVHHIFGCMRGPRTLFTTSDMHTVRPESREAEKEASSQGYENDSGCPEHRHAHYTQLGGTFYRGRGARTYTRVHVAQYVGHKPSTTLLRAAVDQRSVDEGNRASSVDSNANENGVEDKEDRERDRCLGENEEMHRRIGGNSEKGTWRDQKDTQENQEGEEEEEGVAKEGEEKEDNEAETEEEREQEKGNRERVHQKSVALEIGILSLVIPFISTLTYLIMREHGYDVPPIPPEFDGPLSQIPTDLASGIGTLILAGLTLYFHRLESLEKQGYMHERKRQEGNQSDEGDALGKEIRQNLSSLSIAQLENIVDQQMKEEARAQQEAREKKHDKVVAIGVGVGVPVIVSLLYLLYRQAKHTGRMAPDLAFGVGVCIMGAIAIFLQQLFGDGEDEQSEAELGVRRKHLLMLLTKQREEARDRSGMQSVGVEGHGNDLTSATQRIFTVISETLASSPFQSSEALPSEINDLDKQSYWQEKLLQTDPYLRYYIRHLEDKVKCREMDTSERLLSSQPDQREWTSTATEKEWEESGEAQEERRNRLIALGIGVGMPAIASLLYLVYRQAQSAGRVSFDLAFGVGASILGAIAIFLQHLLQ